MPKVQSFASRLLNKLKELSKRETKNLDTKNLDVIKSKLDKEDIKTAYKRINEGLGVRAIRNALDNKLNDKQIETLKEALGGEVIERIKTKALNKKFFFNHRGGWFFDIIINRRLKNNKDENVVYYYGVFLNGNTGWVKVYELASKDSNTLRSTIEDFINDCSKLDINGKIIQYPVKVIISDAESGLPNKIDDVVIHKIVQSHTTHSALSRINAFASLLRKRYRDNTYVSIEQMDEFVKDWNKHKIPVINCSRNQMMIDKELEEAYIASCLYHNQIVDDEGGDIFKVDDEVKIIEKNDDYQHDKQKFGKELSGTYKILSNNKGKIELQNIEDESDKRIISSNNISGRVNKNSFNWKQFFGINDDELNTNPTSIISNVVPAHRTPQQIRENKREAEVYKTARSVRGARESIKINKGIEHPEDRTRSQKKKEVRELMEGERMMDTNQIWKNLSPEKQKEIAERIIEEDRNKNFDWGFIKNFSRKEHFNSLDKFLNHMSPQDRGNMLGELMIYNNRGNINLSDNKKSKLAEKLNNYFEKPENRHYLQEFKNDIEALYQGVLTKNKLGRKLR